MYPLFHCVTPRTQKCYLEPCWTLFFHSDKKLIASFIVSNVIICHSTFLGLDCFIFLIKSGQPMNTDLSWVIYLLASAVLSLVVYLRPRMSAIADYKRCMNANGGALSCTREIFYESFFIHVSSVNSQETKILYSDIDAIWETTNYYILSLKNDRQCVAMDKSGFQGISHEEAYKFLLSKSGKA